jgi:hypothetical protein
MMVDQPKPVTISKNYISVYELSRLRTLFLDRVILLLDPKPLHVSAVFFSAIIRW